MSHRNRRSGVRWPSSATATVELDVPNRRLDLLVPEDELARRRANFTAAPPAGLSGYGELFVQHVTQANLGCDFDFLERREGVEEPVIH